MTHRFSMTFQASLSFSRVILVISVHTHLLFVMFVMPPRRWSLPRKRQLLGQHPLTHVMFGACRVDADGCGMLHSREPQVSRDTGFEPGIVLTVASVESEAYHASATNLKFDIELWPPALQADQLDNWMIDLASLCDVSVGIARERTYRMIVAFGVKYIPVLQNLQSAFPLRRLLFQHSRFQSEKRVRVICLEEMAW